MKKLVNIITLSAVMIFLSSSLASAVVGQQGEIPLSDECTGYFEAEVYCPLILIPEDQTVFLGMVPADGIEYDPADLPFHEDNYMEFTLYGQYNKIHHVTTSMQLSAPGGGNPSVHITDWTWDVENTGDGGYNDYTVSGDVDNGDTGAQAGPGQIDEDFSLYQVPGGHPCDAYAKFRITANLIKADPTAPPGASYSFNVKVNAEIQL